MKVYVEFTAAQDRFCVLTDTCYPQLVKGAFDSVAEAETWATENGYKVNRYP